MGGLAAAVVLVVAVVVIVLSMGGDEKKSAGKKPTRNVDADTKFGLTEPERRQLFYDIIEAVDEFGTGDQCRKKWSQIQKKYNVDDSITAKVLDEGFDAGFGTTYWRQPDNVTPRGKVNFKNWNAEKTQTDHYPMLNY